MDHTISKNNKIDEGEDIYLEKQKEEQTKITYERASIFDLYKYAEVKFIILLIVGTINSIVCGILFPLKFLVTREIFGSIHIDRENKGFTDHIRDQAYWFIPLSIGAGITSYIFTLCFSIVGQKVSYELRWRYMKSILTKDCRWFEENNITSLPYQVNSNLTEVENSTGRTIALICYAISTFVSSFILSLICGVTLGGCMLLIIPFSFICFGIQIYINETDFNESEKVYKESSANAEQALYAIKVVKAFNQTSSEYSIYEKHLDRSLKDKTKNAWIYGIGWGLNESLLLISSIYSFLVSGFFITEDIKNWIPNRTYNTGDTGSIYWLVQSATYFIGISIVSFQSLNRGLICAGSIFKTINHVPNINLDDENSIKIDHIDDIVFENVVFNYSDRNQNAIDGVSLTFRKGKVTALVGPSGSGKTTIAKLLERFYDPQSGSILVNGTDLRNINLRDYRRLIGYVGQEPCLFNESIKNNLLNANPSATDEDIEECLKTAMAYDFVQKLPEGIESNVGALGNKLSGGQKQRIAIARALIRKPDLLILDEATSALDNRNERYVQKAIENINKVTHISTVVIAHRLTTIINANLIVVLNDGRVIEQGNHAKLTQSSGVYNRLFKFQIKSNIKTQFNEDKSCLLDDNFVNANESSSLLSINNDKLERNSNNNIKPWHEILTILVKYNRPYIFIAIALIGAAIVSCSFVLFRIPVMRLSIYFSKNDHSDIRKDMSEYISIMLGIAIISIITQVFTRFCLYFLTSGMTVLIRKETYKSILDKPIEFFDNKQNSIGYLTGVLSTEVRDLNGASVEMYILLYQGIVCLIASLVVSFIYSWNIGLVNAGFLPGVTFSGLVLMKYQMIKPNPKCNIQNMERTTTSDCIANYSTISSLAHEDAITIIPFAKSFHEYSIQFHHREKVKNTFIYQALPSLLVN